MKIETDYYRIQAVGQILVVTSFYAWDEKITSAFAEDVTGFILEIFQGKNWAILHDAREWQLGTPEIGSIVEKLMTTPLTGKLTHHVYVTGPSEIKKWQADMLFSKVTAFKHRVFYTMKEAREWIALAGYKEDISEILKGE